MKEINKKFKGDMIETIYNINHIELAVILRGEQLPDSWYEDDVDGIKHFELKNGNSVDKYRGSLYYTQVTAGLFVRTMEG